MRLSDSFESRAKDGCLEVEALLLDVNIGKNQELMKSCRYLQEYATFVGKVKEYKEQLSKKDGQISQQSQLLEQYQQLLQEHGLLDPNK